jgi:crotonobetainyl-CoA:carnitine CoA-transferase CaiB-like acyl-CoA transferase
VNLSDTAASALHDLASIAGWPEVEEGLVITGDDPVVRTPWRVAALCAASLAAGARAATQAAGLPAQQVTIDARHAGAALRSGTYLRFDGRTPEDPFDLLTGYYRTADERWIYYHCNFPHHRDGLLGLLGAEATREAVQAATARRGAQELESQLAARGLCGGMARTLLEWRSHPQHQATRELPLLEIVQTGDAPPRHACSGTEWHPLLGVRVLDLTRILAGPTCARTLAEYGADVLKVNGPHLPHSGSLEWDTGIGKRAAFLDLRDAAQAARLRELVASADVVSQAYAPGALVRHGICADDLANDCPGNVFVSLSAWSHSGPWSERRGFDTIVQAVTGMVLEEEAHARPSRMPVSAVDYVAGHLLAFGTAVALRRQRTVGGSWMVRTSLERVGHWIVSAGRVENWETLPGEFKEEELVSWMDTLETSAGRLTHLSSPVVRDGRRNRWLRGPSALGAEAPAWT